MIFNITIAVAALIFINFILLFFSCNKTAPKVKAKAKRAPKVYSEPVFQS